MSHEIRIIAAPCFCFIGNMFRFMAERTRDEKKDRYEEDSDFEKRKERRRKLRRRRRRRHVMMFILAVLTVLAGFLW